MSRIAHRCAAILLVALGTLMVLPDVSDAQYRRGGLRHESLGKEDEINSKPFIETLRVNKPAQESLAST